MKVLQRESYSEKHEHTGVWRQGYCYFRTDVVFPAKAGIYVTPTLRDRRSTSAYGQPLRWLKPIHGNSRAYDTGEATWIL